jgi:serine/threonine protein kinase
MPQNFHLIYLLRHPYVLSFVNSSEMEDSLLVVTEYGIPLETWIKNYSSGSFGESEKEALIMEILWGLKCVLDACNFLHINCRISHCMLSPHSCFVTKNGDWKLGFMDLACDISVDTDHFRQNEVLLDATYRSPERLDGSWSEKFNRSQVDTASSNSSPSLGSAVDIFSLGKVIQFVFDTLPFLDMPQCLVAPLKRMSSPDYKRRPTCASLLRLPCFQSDQLALMTAISELQLKPTSECLDVFKILKEKADVISRAACTFKILPSISHSLNQAVTDFQNRDLRELSRQVCLNSQCPSHQYFSSRLHKHR